MGLCFRSVLLLRFIVRGFFSLFSFLLFSFSRWSKGCRGSSTFSERRGGLEECAIHDSGKEPLRSIIHLVPRGKKKLTHPSRERERVRTVTSLNESTPLLGNSKKDYASIVRWMSFANSEILPSLGGWFNPLIGRSPFNKAAIEGHMAATLQKVRVLETHLTTNTWLVGERLTLADLFVTGVVAGGFMCFFDRAWREKHPAVTRWVELVYAQPIFAEVAGKPVFVEKAMPNVPPKKGAGGPPPPPAVAAAAAVPSAFSEKEKDAEEEK